MYLRVFDSMIFYQRTDVISYCWKKSTFNESISISTRDSTLESGKGSEHVSAFPCLSFHSSYIKGKKFRR